MKKMSVKNDTYNKSVREEQKRRYADQGEDISEFELEETSDPVTECNMGKAYDRVMESRKELTKQLISEMSQGELCWIKGWNSTGKRPYNPITKAVYKGGNRFRLMLAAHLEQYTDNRWVTFAQAKEKGWTVKKGEKGMLCEKWIFEEKKTIEDPITGEKETVYEELEHPKVNYFVLFNAAQVEGMPALEKQPELPKDEQLMLADRFVRSSACPVIEQPGETEAYYSPERDEVHLPMRNSFYSSTEFLATAIHEMSHSTGHSSRLNRPQKNAFGSKEYAKEELIAELSSVFVQADLGIDIGAKQLSNHAAYLQNWIGALEENPNVLFQASSDASRASDFLMEQYQKSFIMEQKKENGMVQNADEQKEEKPKKRKFVSHLTENPYSRRLKKEQETEIEEELER